MKLGYIMVGIIFLLNPVVGITDILPDFIGCFIIMLGIRDAGYMIEKFDAAVRWFKYGAWVSMVRFVLPFLNVGSQHTLTLTLSFCIAILECIIYIPAFKMLFDGFDYAAMRHGGSGILSIGKRMGYYYDEFGQRQYGEIQINATGKLAAASQRFIVIRAVASVLPELPDLQLSESQNVGTVGEFEFSSIKHLIILVAVIIALIPGIILLVRYLRFFGRIRRLNDLSPRVYAELTERFGDLGEMHTCSGMKVLSFIAGVAVVLYMGFYDYQINILQRYYPAAVVCLAAVILFLMSGRRWWTLVPVIPALIAVPLSMRTFEMQYDHYYLYRVQMLALYESGNEYFYPRSFNEMDEEYLPMAITESIEALVLGIAIILIAVMYLKLSVKHAKSFVSIPDRLREDTVKAVKIRGGVMISGAVLTTLYFTAYRFILPYFDLALAIGIGVNIAAVIMFVIFALFVNEYVYDNLHGLTTAKQEFVAVYPEDDSDEPTDTDAV